ncbi:hypothetical protein SAMN05421856_1231 [Chryseobacterium taichungense]|uniref:Uncharacterized protein n=2 Tax=Chryseobacterium taichungense TaxID=295069 RepID=A0A1H8DZC8_9FLAO|nr:hypothetical protein SAMN05421856_1231 [Chryseobacterium taichungense]
MQNQIFFYTFSWFTILCSNSYYAQQKQINIFFDKEKNKTYKTCINELDNNEDYDYVKSIGDTVTMNVFKMNCRAVAENYDIYKKNSLKLIEQNFSNKDFIVINVILKSIYRPNPTLTVMKFKNAKDYNALHYTYGFDDISKKSYRITDSTIATDNIEKKFQLLEDYFYNKKMKDRIFENFKDAQKYYKDFSVYYIVAKISGKIITKKIYFADDFNH